MKTAVATIMVFVVLFNLSLSALAQAPTAIEGVALSLDWSPDGQSIAIVANGVWIYQDGQLSELAVDGEITDVAWRNNAKLALARLPTSIQIWERQPSQEFEFETYFLDPMTPIDDSFYIDWHPQENWIAVTGTGVRIWDVDTQTLIRTLPSNEFYTFSGKWSPNGNYIFVEDYPQSSIFNAYTGELYTQIPTSDNSVAWSPDSSRIATKGDEKIDIWNITQLPPTQAFQLQVNQYVGHLDWQGNILATNAEETIVWNASTQEVILRMESNSNFALSPDGSQIAYVENGQVQIQMVNTPAVTPTPIFTFTPTHTPSPTPDPCAYHPTTSTELVNAITTANGTLPADTICLTNRASEP